MYNGDTRLSHAPTLHRKPHMRCVSREIYRYIRPGAAPSRNPHSQRCSVEALLSYPQLLHALRHATRRAQGQKIRPFVNLWQGVSFEKRPWRHHRHISLYARRCSVRARYTAPRVPRQTNKALPHARILQWSKTRFRTNDGVAAHRGRGGGISHSCMTRRLCAILCVRGTIYHLTGPSC